MFKQMNVQPRIASIQEMLKRDCPDQEILQQVNNLLQEYSYIRYALDASAIVAVTDIKGKIIYANNKFCELSKYSFDELYGQDHRILNSGFHSKKFFKHLWDTIRNGDIWEGEVKNKAKDGTLYWVKTTIVPLLDSAGKPIMYIAIRTDISEGKFAQEKLVDAIKNDFSHVVNTMNNIIFKVAKDTNGQFVYILNEGRLAYDLKLDRHNMYMKSPDQVFPEKIARMLEQKYAEAFMGKPTTYDYHFQNRQLLTYLTPIYHNGKVKEIIGCINDITELYKVQEELEYMAYHDLLTGLPNRRKFSDDLCQLTQEASGNKETLAVYFFDLDRFKQINDALGHSQGDKLIKEVSKRLKKVISADAELYRFAGDEFIIIHRNVQHKNQVIEGAKSILSIFDKPIKIDAKELYVTCSTGISFYPEHGTDSDTLLKKADVAMYEAKFNGRNNYRIYEQEMAQSGQEALIIESNLRKAIDNNELELYYQPKLDLKTRKINGMEALLRWHSPKYGNIPPDKFIPIAEETGLIIKIDNWVIEKACEQNKKWNNISDCPLRVAVNISPIHFRLPNFESVVMQALDKTGLDPALLEIEITENSVIDHIEDCIICLKKLRKMGITVSIDDFGKGYSSLNYLRRFPIHYLKIDRSFIHEVSKNKEDAAIVRAITYLAHELNLKVVAEGIETKEVIELLDEIGCDEIQGYYVSKPLPAKEFELRFVNQMMLTNSL